MISNTHKEPESSDPLAAACGIFNGLKYGCAFWVVIGVIGMVIWVLVR